MTTVPSGGLDPLEFCPCGCGFTSASAAKLTRSALPHAVARSLGVTPLNDLPDLPPVFGSVAPLIRSRGLLLSGTDDGGDTSLTVRPDDPVPDKNDKPVKYVNAPGQGAPMWRLRDSSPGSPVAVVEGMLQSRAVAAWAPPNVGVVGLNGASGWHGRDLSFVKGRPVLVFLDKDRDTNQRVRAAALAIDDGLYDAGATDVRFIRLPDDPGAQHNDGPDDYLGRLSEDARPAFVKHLLDTASPLVNPHVDAFEAGLYDTSALDSIPPARPLIPGWLMADSLTRLVGEPGTGKSFTALEWAAAVGTGGMYAGRKAVKGDVLYIVAEGASGIRKRVRAWESHNGRTMEGVYFHVSPVQVMGQGGDGTRDKDWVSLKGLCRRRRFSLIVFDTQSRSTVGVEENSNTEMGHVVDRLESLRSSTGACVLLVHHTAKGGDTGRGAGVVTGALTSEFMLTREGEGASKILKLENTKEKDADDGSVRYLRMQPVDVATVSGSDPFALVETSVVLVEADHEDGMERIAQEVERQVPERETAMRQRMHDLFSAGRGGTKAEMLAMAMTGDIKAGLDPILSRSTFHRIWGRLTEEGLILQIGSTQRFKMAPPGMGPEEFLDLVSPEPEDPEDE